MNRGRFITFEGGEGAGKTTQIGMLADRLRQNGRDVITTREPGGAPGAEAIRSLLVEGDIDRWDALSEVLLHFAARREHLVRTINPALERGAWVLSDRFADSTLAYQGYGQAVDRSIIAAVQHAAIGNFLPDLTLILDLPVETGLARAQSRGGTDRYERMGLDFHRRLRDGFLAIAAGSPDRCVVIDADRSIATVAADIGAIVDGRINESGRKADPTG